MSVLISSIIFTILAMGVIAYVISRKGGRSYFYSLFGLLIGGIIIAGGSFAKVNANEVGIIYNDQNGVSDETMNEGFQVKSIFDHKVETIVTTNKEKEIETEGQTSDSAYLSVKITAIYKIESSNAGKFYKRTGANDIKTEQLNSLAKTCLQRATIKQTIYDILGGELDNVRLDFEDNFRTDLMDQYSITLVSTSFNSVDGGERIEESIKAKAEATQNIEIAQQLKEKQEVDNETAIAKAEAEQKVANIAADVEAYKVNKEKTAFSDAVELLHSSFKKEDGTFELTYKECTDIILAQNYYENWDGVLPAYMGGDADLTKLLP